MRQEELSKAIRKEAQRLHKELGKAEAESLVGFFRLLVRWGQRIRLTGSHDPLELISQHLADALVMSRELGEVPSFIDVGSGGGLPAIPYLLLEHSPRSLLVEVNQRKSVFLRTAVHEMGLQGAEVKAQRVEELGSPDPRFDLVSSRATFAPTKWLEIAEALVAPGGRVLVFVAKEERLPEASGSLRMGKMWRYSLVDGSPRTLACYH
ncbi:MAG: class I SAM-dependent methyltransferase [Deltaproteobacteria bacterium]|nr:class I SAM-dependent methyltransferase [Deltaproteobacteria bacterium]